MKIFNKIIMVVLVLLIVVNIANAGMLPVNNVKINKISNVKIPNVKIPTVACDTLEYNHGGYNIPINTPVQINDKTLYFKNIIKAGYPKNFDLAVTVVVSDIDKNGKISNPVEKILTRGMKDEINGLLVWNTGIYPSTNGKNMDGANFLVRLYSPAVFPNCVNSGLYELGVGDSMMINNVIINMNSIGKPQKVTSFDLIDMDGTYSVVDAAVGDEFDVKGLHIKINENNYGWITGSPWAHTRLEMSRTNILEHAENANAFSSISKSVPEELSIRMHKEASLYDSFLGRVSKV